ncbi:TetR/AcrR family transcriptional regulator [Streptomyces cyanogenus]|uniref:Transcriptional regulator, TetR family n=1 Tax=Streptomyces cyanogenus TaxID=80860 RepID=A0ABX7TW07_STRCY|nr:TetR/AcrR family transcriptional regulator [Streptomyces cyanogenus]QTE00960.1 Transcriptional regulator, TetR family [Streptomyces cyanogenus]
MQSRTPASRTGRPRSAAADAAILAATREALVELGWSKLTLGDVATRAGVAKTTLYRRWAGKNELVVDAVAELFDELELPDRGSLAADIEGVVLQFAAILARPEAKSGLMAVVAEATRDEALRERIRASIVDRQLRLVLEGRARAQRRGELPPEPDPGESARTVDLIFDVVAGAVVHRTLVSGKPADENWVHTFTRLLLLGLVSQPTEQPTTATYRPTEKTTTAAPRPTGETPTATPQPTE